MDTTIEGARIRHAEVASSAGVVRGRIGPGFEQAVSLVYFFSPFFCLAQRALCAAAIFARASADMRRRFRAAGVRPAALRAPRLRMNEIGSSSGSKLSRRCGKATVNLSSSPRSSRKRASAPRFASAYKSDLLRCFARYGLPRRIVVDRAARLWRRRCAVWVRRSLTCERCHQVTELRWAAPAAVECRNSVPKPHSSKAK